jgi:anaerobic selenocysteine-containing dehydrogenase
VRAVVAVAGFPLGPRARRTRGNGRSPSVAVPDGVPDGKAARSKATEAVVARTATADRIAKSVCPYYAVGCSQNVYVKEEMVASAGQGWTAWHGRP